MTHLYQIKTNSEKHWKRIISKLFKRGFSYHGITDVNEAYETYKNYPCLAIYSDSKLICGNYTERSDVKNVTEQELFNEILRYYWKVVRIVDSSKVFKSSNSYSCSQLTYELNKTTVPTVGKIFVFKTRQAARKFRGGYRYEKIFKCKVTNPVKGNKMLYASDAKYEKDLEEFWTSKNFSNLNEDTCPENTYFVDSCTPIEEVH